ncbi:hypothetical protein AB0B25_17415 [Nocardia sp. NPDC049190]|uniref:hypothetical protein n=1 Tax=Nocardia sp. NPDC049190 TaxID=3155650 RepID=UPI003410E5B2
MGDVWQRLTRQAVGGGGFSIEGSTAGEAAMALAGAERALSAIGRVGGGLSFDPGGFGRLPGGKGVELGRKFLDRTEELGSVLRGHRETVHHMRELYLVAGDLFEVTEVVTARGFAIAESVMPARFAMPAVLVWALAGGGSWGSGANAETIAEGVFDKGRNSKTAYKLEDFDSESGGVEFRDSGVAPVSDKAMSWYNLWELGETIRPDPIRGAGQKWIWLGQELRASVEELKSRLGKAFAGSKVGWEGKSAESAAGAYNRFQSELAAVHKGMIAMGTELAFAAGWLAGTPFGMPSESAPVYNMADADEATGHVRGEGYWDFLTSLSEVREYYANSYFAGFVISRKRIPQFAPPKVVSRTDPKSKTDPRKNTDPRKKTDPRKTGERPGQRIGGDQPQPNGIPQQTGPQQIEPSGPKVSDVTAESLPRSTQLDPNADPYIGPTPYAVPNATSTTDHPAPSGGQQIGGQLPEVGDPSTRPTGQSQLGQLGGMAQQAGNLAQQVGQGLPRAGHVPDPAKALDPALRASEGKPPTGGGGRGAGGGGGGGGPVSGPTAPTPMRDYPASLFPRAGTELATGAAPPRAGLPTGQQQPMAGTPGSPGTAAPHGAQGAGQGKGGEHKHPKYLQSTEHLDEALGEAPTVFKAVIDR